MFIAIALSLTCLSNNPHEPVLHVRLHPSQQHAVQLQKQSVLLMSERPRSVAWSTATSPLGPGAAIKSLRFFARPSVACGICEATRKGTRYSSHTPAMSLPTNCPQILYGTAWKGEATATLVAQAVRTGFRGIDTAAQPKHYDERRVGEGLADAMRETGLTRQQFFLQTKYTSIRGQDLSKPLPYDASAPLAEQVAQSISSSLENLKISYLDSLVLHSPLETLQETMMVWRAFEKAIDAKLVLQLGISNCYDVELFKAIFEEARIKPRVLQNRFYVVSGFDVDLRKFCLDKNVMYQSFWTLSANDAAINSPDFAAVARKYHLTPSQAMYAFARSVGVVPLCGTKSIDHMKQDLDVIEKCGADGSSLLDASDKRLLAELLGVPL
jgi:diketogulonate reductase-like aldo/keto reductase